NGSSYSIKTQTVYQQMGRITLESNPTRNTGESTDGWSRSTSDEIGRVVEVASFSGASQPPTSGTNGSWTGSVTTSYDAIYTTVTDQSGKVRRSVVDGLGRLVRLDEPTASGLGTVASPNQPTTYAYDSLSNLTSVVQGTQNRIFTYDSLSRLATAKNPEQVN